jgi:predicted ABC-type ATPase
MVTDSSDEVIAGPKGAGQTTCARPFLAEELRLRKCVNADMIAAGLSPFAPETVVFEAARIRVRRGIGVG